MAQAEDPVTVLLEYVPGWHALQEVLPGLGAANPALQEGQEVARPVT